MVNEAVLGSEMKKLEDHVNKLTAQIKQKQVTLKGLADDVEIAKRESAELVKRAESAASARMNEIEQKVGPLEEELKRLELKRQALASENHNKVEEYRLTFQALKSEKQAELSKLDYQCAERMNKLVTLQQAIEDCKQRVAAI